VPGGAVYLHFELSPSYARDSSQGLRESPAILVLIVRKIQHTQIGSVPVVLSVAFPHEKVSLFVGQGLSHERYNKPYLKFYMKKVVLFTYRMVLRMLGFDG
jgi:hypothetical protein